MAKTNQSSVPAFGMKDKLGYMFGDFGNDFTFILSSTFMMKFYTDVMGTFRWGRRYADDGGAVCGCVFRCDNGADRRSFQTYKGWKIPSMDQAYVRSGSNCKFSDLSGRICRYVLWI